MFDPAGLGLRRVPSGGGAGGEVAVGLKRDRSEPLLPLLPPLPPLPLAPSLPLPPPPPLLPPRPDDSVPSSLPLFTLPADFAFASSDSAMYESVEPQTTTTTAYDPDADPRRREFAKHRSAKFPLAGLMRTDGGVFGFLDDQRRRRRKNDT